jgi:hypothetical protein
VLRPKTETSLFDVIAEGRAREGVVVGIEVPAESIPDDFVGKTRTTEESDFPLGTVLAVIGGIIAVTTVGVVLASQD